MDAEARMSGECNLGPQQQMSMEPKSKWDEKKPKKTRVVFEILAVDTAILQSATPPIRRAFGMVRMG